MKHVAKKLLSLLLITAFVVSMASGCGKKESDKNEPAATKAPEVTSGAGEEAPEATEAPAPVDTSTVDTITVFVNLADYNWDNPVAEEITKKTGIKLQFDVAIDDPKKKLALMQASGQYTDMILKVDDATFASLYEGGALVKLDDLIDQYGPNIKEHYGDQYDRIRMDNEERGIYGFGSGSSKPAAIAPGQYWDDAFWAQIQGVKEQGYPQIKTLDDYTNFLKTELAKNPTTADGQKKYGLSLLTSDGWRYQFSMLRPANLINGYPWDGDYILNKETKQIELAMQQDYVKEFIRWYNKLYNEGLIDPESFTQNYDTYLSKIANGRVVGVIDGFWQFASAVTQLRGEDKGDLTYMPFTPFADPSATTWNTYQSGGPANIGGFSLTTSCKVPEKVVNFFNYLCSEEGKILLEWGIEGVNYTIDADGKRVRNPEDVAADDADPQGYTKRTGVKMYNRGYGQWLSEPYGYKTSNGQLLNSAGESNLDASFTQVEKDVLAKYSMKYFSDVAPGAADLPLKPYGNLGNLKTGENTEELSVVQKNFDDSKLTNLANAIMCTPDEFDTVWEKYMSDLKDMGVDKLVEDKNKALEIRKKLWGLE